MQQLRLSLLYNRNGYHYLGIILLKACASVPVLGPFQLAYCIILYQIHALPLQTTLKPFHIQLKF